MVKNKEIGNRIRKQRELLGYTREYLAEKLEVSTKFCSDIELGHKGMSIETLCKISSILNLSTDYILFGKGDDKTNFHEISTLFACTSKDKHRYLLNILKNLYKFIE